MHECASLSRVLEPTDFARFLGSVLVCAPQVIRTGTLRSVDSVMSCDVRVEFHGRRIAFPLREIDRALGNSDNPTFGNIRELCGRDCYFAPFKFNEKAGTFLDLGANRGMVSILALACLGADRAIGVEPQAKYNPVLELLLEANNFSSDRAPRYNRFLTGPSAEAANPAQNISIETIRKEQGVDRFWFVKMDIEGGEVDVFRDPAWLAHVDNLAMEVHHVAGDLSLIPEALKSQQFEFVAVDQSGAVRSINDAMFLYASKTGSIQQHTK